MLIHVSAVQLQAANLTTGTMLQITKEDLGNACNACPCRCKLDIDAYDAF